MSNAFNILIKVIFILTLGPIFFLFGGLIGLIIFFLLCIFLDMIGALSSLSSNKAQEIKLKRKELELQEENLQLRREIALQGQNYGLHSKIKASGDVDKKLESKHDDDWCDNCGYNRDCFYCKEEQRKKQKEEKRR